MFESFFIQLSPKVQNRFRDVLFDFPESMSFLRLRDQTYTAYSLH